MPDQDAVTPVKPDDVPDGITLVTPAAPVLTPTAAATPTTPAATPTTTPTTPVPEEITETTPKSSGSSILLNPGGDTKFTGPGSQAEMPLPHEPEKGLQDFFTHRLLQSGINYAVGLKEALIPDFGEKDRAQAEAFANLLKGVGRAGARLMGRDLPENQSDDAIQNVKNYVVNRYGSLDKYWDSFYKDPVGTASDTSAAFSALGNVASAARLGTAAKVAGTLGEVTNPLFIPSKAVSGAVRLAGRGRPMLGPTGPPTAPTQDAIRQRAFDISQSRPTGNPQSDWAQAEQELKQSAAAALPRTLTPPASKLNTLLSSPTGTFVKKAFGVVGVGGGAYEMLAHHLMQGMLGGGLIAGAIYGLPKLLASPAGQEMLSRISTGTSLANSAAVARDMIPALNALYKTSQAAQLQPLGSARLPGPRLLQGSGFSSVFARGGDVSPELARIQRERLQLPGITEMLHHR